MTDLRDSHAEAQGMLAIALRRMATNYPFHANLLSAGYFEPDPTVGTMGVTIRHGQLTFLYAPEFVVACSFDELTGLLHHEINHILFGHVFADPTAFPDDEAHVIAQEVTVNEWIREPLPGAPITLNQYPQLPPLEDTLMRYRRLTSAREKRGQTGQKNGPNGPKNEPFGPKNGPPGTKNRPAGPQKNAPLTPLDDHSVWDEARRNKALGNMAVSVAVRQARQRLTADQWDALPALVRQQIGGIGAGTTAGEGGEEIGRGNGRDSVDWRHQLRRFIGRELEIRPVFNRPPRRFPQLVGIIPGSGRRYNKPRIMAVIDTSASLTEDMLSRICHELDRIGRISEVIVVQCDANIQAVNSYRGPIRTIRGRGGTDLRPAFAAKFLRRHRPDVILYFTDGDGPAPSQRPGVPVVWCLTPAGKTPAQWGKTLRLNDC